MMKNLSLAVTLCFAGVFTPPNYLTAQASWVYESQNTIDELTTPALLQYNHNKKTYYDPVTQILVIGTTVYNPNLNIWEVLLQGIDKSNGNHIHAWDYRYSYNPPYQPKTLQFHSIDGNFNQVVFTSTQNLSTTIFGPVGEFYVTSLDILTGNVNWNYSNTVISNSDFLKDVIIKSDINNDFYIAFIKKFSLTNSNTTIGIIKLDANGVELWDKGAKIISTPTVDAHLIDLTQDISTNDYIVCVQFDHGNSPPQAAVFTINCNSTTGTFGQFDETFAMTVSSPPTLYYDVEDYPVMITVGHDILIGIEGTQNLTTDVVMAKLTTSGIMPMTLLKKYSLPTGKTHMRFIKIINTSLGLKVLLELTSSVLNQKSWAVSDLNSISLELTNFNEYEFISGVNEEEPIDILEINQEIYVLSKLITFNGNPSNFKSMKLTNISHLAQNPSCYPIISHTITSTTLDNISNDTHQTGYVSWEPGLDDEHMFPFTFNGVIKDCWGGNPIQYKTDIKSVKSDKSTIKLINDGGEVLQYTISGNESNVIRTNIYSLDGKLTLSESSNITRSINIQSLTSGSYIVVFTLSNGVTKSIPFVK